jgi:hypothetical protein
MPAHLSGAVVASGEDGRSSSCVPTTITVARLRDYRTLVLSTLLIFLHSISPMNASPSPVVPSDEHW